jgi:NADP-dependent 3-hydroxy acid dehydrogenase YdfG
MQLLSFSEKAVVVTGASSGIGRAIALAFAAQGARLCLVGRDAARLDATAREAAASPQVLPFPTDLTAPGSVEALAEAARSTFGGVDVLVHSAGAYYRGRHQEAAIGQLDQLYQANVRAPYLLTQLLLPLLKESQGQVAFINSSQALNPGATVGQFAATQHALKAMADVLREEVNPDGIRVLSVFLGRTATPRMERIVAAEGREYQPGRMLQPEDVAAVVLHSLSLPRTAEVTNVTLRPMLKG